MTPPKPDLTILQSDDLESIRQVIKDELANGIKTQLDQLSRDVTAYGGKVTNLENVLYGEPGQIEKPGLIALVLKLAEQAAKTRSIWDKLVEYLVVAFIGGLIVLLATHGLPPFQ